MSQYQKKQYHITEISPGMELGDVVCTEDHRIILSEGTILTAEIIEKLEIWGIPSVIIRDNLPGKGSSSPRLQSQRLFYDEYQVTVQLIKQSFETMRFFKEVPISQMAELVDTSIDSMINSVGVINHLHMVRSKDDYTFQHSVNVAIIAGILGKWLGFRTQRLKDVILAGLLHDIGKTQIPLEILNKPGNLSDPEMEIMKQHTVLGYKMLSGIDDISLGAKSAVIQHHERMNGTGYPLMLEGTKIHPYAKVIAVADIFDAMTSDRIYRQKMSPFLVMEMLVSDMFQKLDPEICTTFLNNIRDYFVGNLVGLSDGRKAKVVNMGQFVASRPIVQTQDGQFIDLERNKHICITKVLQA